MWEKIFKYSILSMLTIEFIELLIDIDKDMLLNVFYVFRSYFGEIMFVILSWVLFSNKIIRLWVIPLAAYWLYEMFVHMTFYIDRELYNKLNYSSDIYAAMSLGVIALITTYFIYRNKKTKT